jgi:hypothetical protein
VSGAIVYVGDAVTGAGLRLAGVQCVEPPAGTEAAAVQAVAPGAALLLLSRAVAAALPRALLDNWLAAGRPLVTIVPDAGPPLMSEPAERARMQLGIER